MINSTLDRVLLRIEGEVSEPSVIFFCGIHGNEPAGVLAIQDLKERLIKMSLKGSLYVFRGNIKAFQEGVRYIDKDLNRLWSRPWIDKMCKGVLRGAAEFEEQRALYEEIKNIINTKTGPLFFVDFHTTSSKTLPFITIDDAIINRRFSKLFPVPTVLGIEEYLNGPLLSFINQLGFLSIGFESGEHHDAEAVLNAKAFMLLTLCYSGLVDPNDLEDFNDHFNRLKKASDGKAHFYEVIERYTIKENEMFVMEPGFKSFQEVNKGELLAKCNGEPVLAKNNTMLFMPLYQPQGNDGYFLIRRISSFFLRLSTYLRGNRLDSVLVYLPGVTWNSLKKDALKVNLRVARFLARPIFHLLGYRHYEEEGAYLIMYNRERTTRTHRYNDLKWFQAK
ncbi:Succinylglutamate desuccinylase / Aspartoacylase family protein [Zhouia amylolytica]|uniref:Succinylglutamate desuccinylase / Aspartoacylase family protein n=1 Tax=Zhouia amylolytica TaxID=376730 RepID=A0A1I6U3W6_9FLAO|nr:succinylglutamate desuccinylase/aspartoacylase family protein [Zhouia amylolytica]SFS96091.1 Succinylglutamate desuccinylase / Aspartoacylase family protein [Zhouia amylolytica]